MESFRYSIINEIMKIGDDKLLLNTDKTERKKAFDKIFSAY